MAGNGPKREPAELSALKGHPSNRTKERLDAPKTELAPLGWEPPAYLKGEGRREWKRLVSPLVRIGLLTIADRDVFAGYCTLHGRHALAEHMINREGHLKRTPNGHEQPSAWITISRDALTAKLRYMAALGLTPADRSKVIAGTPPSTPDEPTTKATHTPAPATPEDIPDEELFGKGTRRPH